MIWDYQVQRDLSVILETQVPGGLREVGDCLAWKDHEVRLDREACRENRVPRGCLAAKVQLEKNRRISTLSRSA